ncbi:uncharacterized protein LOC131440547 [Malaya genurostris]|uniref:uncharacterized protein LOC131440547 n=1 Tax=Malaya genurostris TaxID=325434 RepID=UPI0026F3D178|nr:uncharacterized protein LOC131440547 [Malaya genurostris]
MNENSHDEPSTAHKTNWHDEYNRVLEKLKNKIAENKKQKESIEKLRKDLAEAKDIALFQIQENQRLKSNGQVTFTTDPNIKVTVKQLEDIDRESKSVGQFVQNLALLMYGAEALREMSVTGRKYAQSTDKLIRPAIDEAKLQFIYKKAQERVGLHKGMSNFSIISLEANRAVINRALAEKIANLRKAAIYASNRNIRN